MKSTSQSKTERVQERFVFVQDATLAVSKYQTNAFFVTQKRSPNTTGINHVCYLAGKCSILPKSKSFLEAIK